MVSPALSLVFLYAIPTPAAPATPAAFVATLTGSIGVIVENQNFSELSQKIGVSIDTTKSGKIKGRQNPLSPLDPLVKINNQKLVNFSFDWFISLIKLSSMYFFTFKGILILIIFALFS